MAQYDYVNPNCLCSIQSKKLEVDKDVFIYYVDNARSVSFLTRGLTGDRVDIPLNGQNPEFVVKKWYNTTMKNS